MIVRFDLGQNMGQLITVLIRAIRTGVETADFRALDDGGVIGIGDYRALRMRLVRLTDHAEQRFVLRNTVGQ